MLFFIILSFCLSAQESATQTDQGTTTENNLAINSTGDNNPNPISVDGGIGLQDYLVVIFVLILVIGALYGVLKVIKRVGGTRFGVDNDLIHILSTKTLKGTTALHLIEVGKQIFLVGATDHSINSIAEITEQETKDMIALNLSAEDVKHKTFFQYFSEKLKENRLSNDGDQATTSLKTNKDRLEKF